MVLSFQPVLHCDGHSLETRGLLGVIPSAQYMYDETTGKNITLAQAFEHVARDCVQVYDRGFATTAVGQRLYAACLGTKGDQEFMLKSFGLTRYWAKNTCCWACLAHKRASPNYRDTSDDAEWRSTVDESPPPWASPPVWSTCPGFHRRWLTIDTMHAFHLGVGQDTFASGLQALIKQGIFSCAGAAYLEFRSWCRNTKKYPAWGS